MLARRCAATKACAPARARSAGPGGSRRGGPPRPGGRGGGSKAREYYQGRASPTTILRGQLRRAVRGSAEALPDVRLASAAAVLIAPRDTGVAGIAVRLVRAVGRRIRAASDDRRPIRSLIEVVVADQGVSAGVGGHQRLTAAPARRSHGLRARQRRLATETGERRQAHHQPTRSTTAKTTSSRTIRG